MRRYIDVLKQILNVQRETRAALKDNPEPPFPQYFQTEVDTLKRLRIKNDITERTAEEEAQKKKSKKGKKDDKKKPRVEMDELDVDLEYGSDDGLDDIPPTVV